jgi:hypothetical protein
MPLRTLPARGGAVLLVAGALMTGCGGSDDGVTTEPAPGSTPSMTGTGPASDREGTHLTITLDETGKGPARTFELTCDPPGGNHPNPHAACNALADAGGAEAFQPPPGDLACTQVYGGPQTATVTGLVNGAAVSKAFSRTDGCGIARWDALAPLLGAPGGGEV